MAFGIKIYSSTGDVQIDMSDRLPAVFDERSFSFTAGQSAKSITVSGVNTSDHFAFTDSMFVKAFITAANTIQLVRTQAQSGYPAISGSLTVMRM